MELKIKLPSLPENAAQTVQTILWGCIGGALAALVIVVLLRGNADTARFATVDILAIENNDEAELAEAIKKNDQKKAKAMLEQRVARSRTITKAINDVAAEKRVVIVVNQAVAGGDLPDLTAEIIARLNNAEAK